MGNVEAHDLGSSPKDDSQELDLSVPVNYGSFCKHVNGEYSNQCMKDLPEEVVETMRLHERLNLAFNCLKNLPENLPYGLPHLTVLNVSYNQLITLPDTICYFFHLKELILNNNQIVILPLNLFRLTNLKKLDLSYNLLEEISEAIGNMKSLEKLNVSHNKLNQLPISLGSSSTLKVLLAMSNMCESMPPQSICDKGSASTIAYLQNLNKANRQRDSTHIGNVFPRIRGNIVQTSVPNPHSARAQYVQIQTETMNTASRIKTPLLLPLNATYLHIDKLKDRLIGLIYGAAVGDSLGIATEFLSSDECQFHYEENNFTHQSIIKDEHRAHWSKGDWTSNSDQMLLVLDSLLHWAGVIDELEFAKRLILWKKHGIPELGPRENYLHSCLINLVLQDDNYAQNPHQIAQYVHKKFSSERTNGFTKVEEEEKFDLADSGSLPRAIILGIPHFYDLQEVISNSVRICRATHNDERCIASSVVLSVVVSLLLQGSHSVDDLNSIYSMFEKAFNEGVKFINNQKVTEQFLECSHSPSINNILISDVGTLDHIFKPLATAVWAMKQNGDFKKVLNSVLMCGGYSSMNGCISGALLGCKHGFSQIPSEWINGLLPKNKALLNARINSLLDMMAIP